VVIRCAPGAPRGRCAPRGPRRSGAARRRRRRGKPRGRTAPRAWQHAGRHQAAARPPRRRRPRRSRRLSRRGRAAGRPAAWRAPRPPCGRCAAQKRRAGYLIRPRPSPCPRPALPPPHPRPAPLTSHPPLRPPAPNPRSSFFEEKGLVRQQLDSFNEFVTNTIQEVVDESPEVTPRRAGAAAQGCSRRSGGRARGRARTRSAAWPRGRPNPTPHPTLPHPPACPPPPPQIIVRPNEQHYGGDDAAPEGGIDKEFRIKFGQIFLSKPLVTEADGETAALFPKEARLRNLTCGGRGWVSWRGRATRAGGCVARAAGRARCGAAAQLRAQSARRAAGLTPTFLPLPPPPPRAATPPPCTSTSTALSTGGTPRPTRWSRCTASHTKRCSWLRCEGGGR
jgi:hypothetical protein